MPKPVRKVYLTYASEDSSAARKVSDALESAGYDVWDSDRSLLPGEAWAAKVQKALDTSDAMVVLVSPYTSKSRYLQNEIGYALGAERYSGRLVPVMLAPTRDYPWIFDDLQMVRESTPEAAGKAVAEILAHEPNATPARRGR